MSAAERLKSCDRITSLPLCLVYSTPDKSAVSWKELQKWRCFYCGLWLVHPRHVIRVNTATLLWGAVEKYSVPVAGWLFMAGCSIPQLYYRGKHREAVTGNNCFVPFFFRVIFIEGMQWHVLAFCYFSTCSQISAKSQLFKSDTINKESDKEDEGRRNQLCLSVL